MPLHSQDACAASLFNKLFGEKRIIIVLAEVGGRRLLGKAREIADSLGFRVVAVCSRNNADKAQELISLGADEVISFNAESVNDWSKVLAYLIRNEKQTKFVLLPSNPIANAILGSTYALASERIGSFADGVEKFNDQGASKVLHPSEIILQTAASSEKVSMWSVKLNFVPEPFEDSSRYGKTRTLELPKDAQIPNSPSIENSRSFRDLTSILTILVGRNFYEGLGAPQKQKLHELAKKYSGTLLEISGSVQVVYGPCLAIEIGSSERELPEFQSDLLSINTSKDAPISTIAKLSAASPDVGKVVEELLNAC